MSLSSSGKIMPTARQVIDWLTFNVANSLLVSEINILPVAEEFFLWGLCIKTWK